MSDLDNTKLRRLDLTVLLIFLGLMRHRKAAAVAAEMGLTNSSISHALRRLRDVFDDPLFLRRPHGLEPTAFALGIEAAISNAVRGIDGALAPVQVFDPATSTDPLRLSAPDHAMDTVVADFLDICSREAPGLALTVRALPRAQALSAVSEGSIDLALGFFWDLPQVLSATTLASEGYLTVARKDHPLMSGPIGIEDYCAARHLLISPDGSREGIVDRILAADGLARHVAVVLPLFLPALAVLQRSDLIATLPERMVERHAARFGLAFQPPPLAIRAFDLQVVWHRRDEKNPLLTWAVEGLARCAGAPEDSQAPEPLATGNSPDAA